MKAIILAAGEGKRMRPLTLETPKPMITVLDKPILHHIIDALPKQVTELVLVVGYKGDQIRSYFGDRFEGRPVTYVHQDKQLGTGHALGLCRPLIKQGEKFLFMIGDDLHSPAAIEKLLQYEFAMLVHEHEDPRAFGVVEVDKNDRVTDFVEKPEQPKSNLVSPAVFVMDDRIFSYAPKLHGKGEYFAVDQINQMMKDVPLIVVRSDFWLPIGHPHDVDKAEMVLRDKYRLKREQVQRTLVIIIAGGKGTRMPEHEKEKPKCLVDIAGKPMLARQIEELRAQGFYNIRLALGYKAEMVVEWLKQNKFTDVSYVIEKEPLGTGGAIKLALGASREPFIAINCDDLADVNLLSLMRHSCGNVYNVVSAFQINDARTFGLIECDDQKKICAFKEKDESAKEGLVSVGHYYLQPDIFDGMEGAFMIERDVFPKLAEVGKLVLHRHTGYWVTANNAEQLKGTREHFAKTNH